MKKDAIEFAVKWWTDRISGKVADIKFSREMVMLVYLRAKAKNPSLRLSLKRIEKELKEMTFSTLEFPSDWEVSLFEKELRKVVVEKIEKDGFCLLQMYNCEPSFELAGIIDRLEIEKHPLRVLEHVDMFVDKNQIQLRYNPKDAYETIFDAELSAPPQSEKAEKLSKVEAKDRNV